MPIFSVFLHQKFPIQNARIKKLWNHIRFHKCMYVKNSTCTAWQFIFILVRSNLTLKPFEKGYVGAGTSQSKPPNDVWWMVKPSLDNGRKLTFLLKSFRIKCFHSYSESIVQIDQELTKLPYKQQDDGLENYVFLVYHLLCSSTKVVKKVVKCT